MGAIIGIPRATFTYIRSYRAFAETRLCSLAISTFRIIAKRFGNAVFVAVGAFPGWLLADV